MIKTHLMLDLDGTLIDSSSGIYNSFSVACNSLGLTCPQFSNFVGLIGPPVERIVESIYPELSSIRVQDFKSIFRQDYDSHSFLDASWYPGTLKMLDFLSGIPQLTMTIVTNKPTEPATQLIKNSGLLSCFSRIIGIDYPASSNVSSRFSSKAQALEYVLRTSSSCHTSNIYVGDTPSDQKACAICHIPFVAALYGFHCWNVSLRPALSINNFTEIYPLIFSQNTKLSQRLDF